MSREITKLVFGSIEIDNSKIEESDEIAARIWLHSLIGCKPSSAIIQLTPAMAFELLRNNSSNRSISHNNLEFIERAILDNTFRLNGEAVSVADTGELNDGQHRSIAVVRANKPVQTMIAYGLERDSRMTVDIGRKRTTAGFLSMQGVKYSTLTSSVVSALWQYDNFKTIDSTSNVPSSTEVLTAYEAYQTELNGVIGKVSYQEATAVGGQSLLCLAFLLFRRKNPQAAAEFIDLFVNGIGLDRTSPVLVTRNRLIKDHSSNRRLKRGEKFELILRAWNSWRRGESVRSLPVMNNLPPIES